MEMQRDNRGHRFSRIDELSPQQLGRSREWTVAHTGEADNRVDDYLFYEAFDESPERAAETLDWLASSGNSEVRRMAAANIDRLLSIDRDRCVLIWSQLLCDRVADVKQTAEETLAAHALSRKEYPRLTRDELFNLILVAQGASLAQEQE